MSSKLEDNKYNRNTSKRQKTSRFVNSKKTDIMKDIFPELKLSRYDVSISKPIEVTSGAGLLCVKRSHETPDSSGCSSTRDSISEASVVSTLCLMTTEEDRVPIHQGPLKDPNKRIIYKNNDGTEFDITDWYKGKDESERLFELLNPYRYKMCLLREADINPDESKRLVKLLKEELQQKLEGSSLKDFNRPVDFYIGRHSIDRTTNQPIVQWQPIWIVFYNELIPDDDAQQMKSRVSGVYTAKAFKFDSLPCEMELDKEFWKEDKGKMAFKSPYTEANIILNEDGTLSNGHFKSFNNVRKGLFDYLNLIDTHRQQKSEEKIVDGKKGHVTFSSFELSRWGNEALLDNWNQIISIIISKSKNDNYFI